MAHYQIEENLRTTNGQRAVSWAIAMVASAIIAGVVFLMDSGFEFVLSKLYEQLY